MLLARKNWLAIVFIAVLSLGVAASAWAAKGMGMGGGCPMMAGECPMMGGGMGMKKGRGMGMQMTPEQAAQAFDLHQKFMTETADLRKQMMIKRAELGELWRAKDPDQAKIAAKQKEMNALRDQLQEKAIPYKAEMKQHCPAMGGGPKGPPAAETPKKP